MIFSIIDNSPLQNTRSFIIEAETTAYSDIALKPFEIDRNKISDQIETYLESLVDNVNAFSTHEKKIKNTWFGFHGLWDLSPVVLQDQIFMRNNRKSVSHKIIPKLNLDTVMSKMSQKFDISNTANIKKFVSTPIVLEMPNLVERLDKIIECVSSFMSKLDFVGKSEIDVFNDEEIEDFQLITIEYHVKNSTSDQCIQFTRDLVYEITQIDEDMLNMIQVEVIPDDN